jgi:iron complex outermembrane recepter protein
MSNQVSRQVRRIIVASAFGLAAAGTLPVLAADAATDSDLDEVIVTAQNRAQDVNDVPIAIDVVSAEELRDAGFSSMNDITQIAPVVQLNQDQGTVKVTVRGVGTTSNDEAQDTSVVVNIDGEYINRPNVLGVALFDMQRVEVLRGPQGTLYGRNSTGGAINFITRKPGKELGANASVSYGNYDALHVDAGVDIPMGDLAAVRLAVFKDKRDGYVKHSIGRSDDNDAQGVRLSAHIDATDALSFDLAAEMARREFTPGVFAAADLNAAGVGPRGPGCNASGFVSVPVVGYTQTLCVPANTNLLAGVNRGEFTAPAFGLGNVNQSTHAFRGKMAYEISPSATLTYTGGLRRFFGDPDNFLTLPVVYRSFSFQDVADTQSHELRLSGDANGIVYQVGAFYFKEDLNRESGFFLPIGANGSFLSYFGRDVQSDSRSLFGQIEVPFAETFTAVAGLRYTDSDRKAVYQNASPFGAGPPDFFLGSPTRPTTNYLFNSGPGRKNFAALPYGKTLNLNPAKEDKITWLAGINYKPDSDTLVYGKVSTGFKAGGFDSTGAYKPETNTAVEAGMKKTVGRSQINFGAFYYDYKDLQVSVLLDTTVGGQTFNAGKAKIWGVEASGDFGLTDNDRVRVSANYLNSEYKELLAQFNVFCVACGNAPLPPDINGIGDLNRTLAGVQQPNFAGNRTPFSPKFILAAGYDHTFQLGSSGSLTFSADATYKTSYFTDFYNYNDARQKSFTQADATLDYKPQDGNYSVQAYAKNIGNKRPLTYGSFISAGSDDVFNWQFGAPRTYGLRVNVDF